MQKGIISIYRNGMTFLMILIMGYLSVSSFLWNADLPLDGVSEKTVFKGTAWYITIPLVFLALYALHKYKEKLAAANARKLVAVLLVYDFILCMFWIVLSNTIEGADQAQVLYAAKQFAAGNYEKLAYDKYMGLYPYQLPLALLYEPFYHVFGDVTPFLWQFINAFLICGIQYLLYLIVGKCFKKKGIVNLYLVLQFGNLPLILYVAFVYGTVIGLFFALLSVWFLLKYADDYKWRNLVLSALCITWSCLLRTNNLIVLLAVIIVSVLFFLSDRKRTLLLIPLSLILLFCGRECVYKSYEIRSGMEIGKGMPFSLNIATGLSDNEERAPGWFNGYTWQVYYDLDCDRSAENAFAAARINEALEKFGASGSYAAGFFCKKINSTWLNPDFQGLWNNEHHGHYVARAPIVHNLFTGELHSLSQFLLGNIQFMIYFGTFLSMLCCLFQKETDWKFFICALIFIGGFVFHLFWETKAQYVIVYYVFLFPYAAEGLSWLSEIVFRKREDKKNVIR